MAEKGCVSISLQLSALCLVNYIHQEATVNSRKGEINTEILK